ncbi:Nucleolar protein 58, partial [Dirofilaria immitis]|nr:Nucleolar protein 58 [Dirofilaria immitis]
MLVLFETPAGYALFKLLDEKKLENVDNIWDECSTPEKAQRIFQLISFKKFKDTAEAVENVTRIKKDSQGKLHEDEMLAVGEVKLGNMIKEKFNVSCIYNAATQELMRSIRANLDSLLDEHKQELHSMNLAVAHSLGRYRVKFNPEKIDTMIVQAVSLLDDLDKELNNYVMRCREWYGWHFPELSKIIQDHQAYTKTVKAMGMRSNAKNCDLSNILPPELEARIKEEAEISMGTDISNSDTLHISGLCEQIIELTKYRSELADYLKNRMMVLAPNLTILLGELVGARLISHAGSLVNLAKYPASTVQILGAEKALFRALKTKRDTPKYGLIYHAQLIGQASTKIKGKVARKLAAKVSLSTRIDALADESMGTELGEKERGPKRITGKPVQHDIYTYKSTTARYDSSADSTVKSSKKRKFVDDSDASGGKGPDTINEVGDGQIVKDGPPPKKHRKKKGSNSDYWEMLYYFVFVAGFFILSFTGKAENSFCFGTLRLDLPVRYLHIQLRHGGLNVTQSIGPLKISILGSCRYRFQLFDCYDGSYIFRLRLWSSCLQIVIDIHTPNGVPLCNSPVVIKKWMHEVGCASRHSQLDSDLSQWSTINFEEVLKTVKRNGQIRNIATAIRYAIIKSLKTIAIHLQLYRRCFGEYTGFRIFVDAAFTSLMRKMYLPNTEFIFNLGDWPLVELGTDPVPMISWCGSKDTMDIVVPTYELMKSVIDSMESVTLDIHSLRLKIAKLSKLHPNFLDAGITRYFFFNQSQHTPMVETMPFSDFFK